MTAIEELAKNLGRFTAHDADHDVIISEACRQLADYRSQVITLTGFVLAVKNDAHTPEHIRKVAADTLNNTGLISAADVVDG